MVSTNTTKLGPARMVDMPWCIAAGCSPGTKRVGKGGGGREKRERKEKASLVGGTYFEYVY